MLLGVISDTHGLVRPSALKAFAGCDRILHAGDIGSPAVLAALGELAPVTAVRGNLDRDDWARALPTTEVVDIGDRLLYLLHDLAEFDLDPVAAGVSVVVSGHSHKPLARYRDGVLYLNPGSAGPRRFRLPISIARLRLTPARLEHELVELRD